MTSLRIIIISTAILLSGQVYSQTVLQASEKVIVDDVSEHLEMSVHPWGSSHGLFFGAKVDYSGSGHLWTPDNTKYAQGEGPYSFGAFSMGYIANGGLFAFYDGGLSTGAGNRITWNPVMSFVRGGNVGIGTTTPRGIFDVSANGDVFLANSPNTGTAQSLFLPGHIYIAPYAGGNISYLQARRQDNSGSTSLQIRTYNSGNLIDAMLISSNGNVLIGKTSQSNSSYKLDINGNVRSNKIVVNTTGADFVFEDNYTLRKLEELQKFIQQNKHLPEIPSAKEMEKDDLDVGDMNIKLLQKIEEMTLYIIAQNKKMQELEERIKNIESKK